MNALIIIISILCTIASIELFRRACGSMSLLRLNTVSYVFYVQIVTSGLIASVLLAIGALDYNSDVRLISDEVKIEAWIWTMYSIIIMPLGMLALNRFLRIEGRKAFLNFLKAPVEIRGTYERNQLAILALTVFGIAVLAYVLLSTERVPLYTLIVEGDVGQANIDRISSRRNFGGIVHIKNLLGLIVVPVISYYSYILLRVFKTRYFFLFFLVNFSVGALMVSHDIQKAPIAFFVLGFGLVEVFVSKGISVKTFLIFLGIPVVLILVGYSMTSDRNAFDQLLRFNSAFYGRTFVVGYYGFPLSLELFPNVITDPTHAIGVPRFLIGEGSEELRESARLLKMYAHPETIKTGKGNLYSGFYMGEAWANYGYIGLVIAPLIVGFVIQSVHLFVLHHKKNPWLLAFYAGITVKWVVGAGFVNFLFLKLLIWPFILYAGTNYVLKLILKPTE